MNTGERIRESIEDDENATGNATNTGRQESATANPHVFSQEKNPWELLKAIKSLTGTLSN